MHRPIRILHVNPLSSDHRSVQCTLEKKKSDFQVIGARSRQELEARLEEHDYDLVLSDSNVPGFEGLQILDTIKAKASHLPVVFAIESDSEEIAIEAMERGAAGYVLKTSKYLGRLFYTIWAVLENKYLQDERERAEEILWEYTERLDVVSKIDQAVDESLKQQAGRLKILHEIYRSLLEARSSEAIAEAALEHLQRLVPYQRASIVVFDYEADEVIILATHGNRRSRLRSGMHSPLTTFRLTKSLKQGKIRVVNDISKLSHPTSTDQILLAENIRAYLNVPLITQDKLIGSLNLGANSSHTFTSEHIEIVREVADQVAIAIQQAHLYEQVQRYATELEQHVAERTAELRSANAEMERVAHELRQLIDTANAPIFGIDTNGLVNEWNQTTAKITSYSKGEVIGKDLVENFIPEEYKSSVKEVLDQALEGIETANFELPLYTKHDQRLIVLLNASARRDVSGEIIGIVGIGQDITERRRAEVALSWEAGVNAAMAELSRALMATSSISDISCRVLEHAKRFTNSKFGYVGYIDPHTGCLVCPAMSKDIWDPCQAPEKDDMTFEAVRGLGNWVLENRKSLLTNSLTGKTGLTGLPQVPPSIYRFISVPARLGETIVGQISLANSDRDYIGRDLAMLERLAQLYAIALERKQAEKELRQLSTAVEQSAASIVITDLDGNIVFVNKAFEKSTGYTKESFMK